MIKKRKIFNISIVLTALTAISTFSMIYPLILSRLIDSALTVNFNLLRNTVIVLIGVLGVILVAELVHKMFRIKYINDIKKEMQRKFLNGLFNMRFSEFSSKNSSEYISIFNNDLDIVIENYYDERINLYFHILSSVVGILALFSVNYILAFISIITSLFPLIIPLLFKKKLSSKRKNVVLELEGLNIKLKEAIGGIDLIKSFNLTSYIKGEFSKKASKVLKQNYKYARLEATSEMIVGALSFTSNLCLIVIGTIFIFNKTITAGELLACIQISDLLISPILSISMELNNINSTKVIKNDLEKILNTKNNKSKSINIEGIDEIDIKDLSFSYGKKRILSDINYTFRKNKKYAIVGQSGSGKSTLLNILSGKLDDYKGSILINNYNLKDIKEEAYYNKLSILHQDIFIFNDSLINNISLFKSYDKANIDDAICKSGLSSLLSKNNNELMCLNEGSNLSGGEKQRVAIARAIFAGSEVFLLDEVTSALDNISHIDIKKMILEFEDKIVIDITHKLDEELLNKYDEIIIMEDGKIIESGSYNRLIIEKSRFCDMIN